MIGRAALGIALAAGMAAASGPAIRGAPPRYAVRSVNNGDGNPSRPFGVNGEGEVVGEAEVFQEDGSSRSDAFYWSNGRFVYLAPNARASAINDRGLIVGERLTGPGRTAAMAWRVRLTARGAVISEERLPDLGGPEARAWDVNSRGMVVGSAQLPDGRFRAVLWHRGRIRDLGTLGGRESDAFGINDRGDVAGGAEMRDGRYAPFLWRAGRMRRLAVRAVSAFAVAVNERRLAAINAAAGEAPRHRALLWRAGSGERLDAGGGDAAVSALDRRGRAVGSTGVEVEPGVVELSAALWTARGRRNLNDEIPAGLGWRLQHATSIADSGRITGWGTLDGRQHGFVLIPIETPPPTAATEPGSDPPD